MKIHQLSKNLRDNGIQHKVVTAALAPTRLLQSFDDLFNSKLWKDKNPVSNAVFEKALKGFDILEVEGWRVLIEYGKTTWARVIVKARPDNAKSVYEVTFNIRTKITTVQLKVDGHRQEAEEIEIRPVAPERLLKALAETASETIMNLVPIHNAK